MCISDASVPNSLTLNFDSTKTRENYNMDRIYQGNFHFEGKCFSFVVLEKSKFPGFTTLPVDCRARFRACSLSG